MQSTRIPKWFWPIAVIALIGYASLYITNATTLTPWWKIAAICGSLSACSGMLITKHRHHLTHTTNRIANFLCHVITTTGLLIFIACWGNLIPSPWAKATTEQAVINRIYHTEHKKMRRVARNRYTASGEKYYRYYADITLHNDVNDSITKTIPIPKSKVCRLRQAKTVDINIRTGLFGISTISLASKK